MSQRQLGVTLSMPALSPAAAERFTCLEKVADDARDALVISDSGGRIVLFSRSASMLFGYSADEMLATGISRLMTEPFKSHHDMYMRNYVASGQGQILGIGPRYLPAIDRSGRVLPVQISVSELSIEGRRYFVALMRKVSAGETVGDALLESYAELNDELNRAKAAYRKLEARYRELLGRRDAADPEHAPADGIEYPAQF